MHSHTFCVCTNLEAISNTCTCIINEFNLGQLEFACYLVALWVVPKTKSNITSISSWILKHLLTGGILKTNNKLLLTIVHQFFLLFMHLLRFRDSTKTTTTMWFEIKLINPCNAVHANEIRATHEKPSWLCCKQMIKSLPLAVNQNKIIIINQLNRFNTHPKKDKWKLNKSKWKFLFNMKWQ